MPTLKSVLMILLILSVSCASNVWVTEKTLDGGIIAYEGADRSDFQEKYAMAARSICGDKSYETVKQRQRSKNVAFTSYENQSSNVAVYDNRLFSGSYGKEIGSATISTRVPVTQNYTTYWWENQIRCKNGSGPPH